MTAQPVDQALVNDFVGNAHGNFERVRDLLEQEPALLNASAIWGETALQAASQMGDRQIAEYLLSKGAPLDFHAAAMLGRRDDVERFLRDDPSLANSRGVHGFRSLYFPVAGGQREIAELLYERGAEVNDEDGVSSPLHAAVLMRQPEMARWLLERGANVQALDHDYKTPLDYARERGDTALVELLRECGAEG